MLSLRNQVLRQEGVNSVPCKGGADEVNTLSFSPPDKAHCSLIIVYTFLIFKEATIICFIMKE